VSLEFSIIKSDKVSQFEINLNWFKLKPAFKCMYKNSKIRIQLSKAKNLPRLFDSTWTLRYEAIHCVFIARQSGRGDENIRRQQKGTTKIKYIIFIHVYEVINL
jgi:hypothetical protein